MPLRDELLRRGGNPLLALLALAQPKLNGGGPAGSSDPDTAADPGGPGTGPGTGTGEPPGSAADAGGTTGIPTGAIVAPSLNPSGPGFSSPFGSMAEAIAAGVGNMAPGGIPDGGAASTGSGGGLSAVPAALAVSTLAPAPAVPDLGPPQSAPNIGPIGSTPLSQGLTTVDTAAGAFGAPQAVPASAALGLAGVSVPDLNQPNVGTPPAGFTVGLPEAGLLGLLDPDPNPEPGVSGVPMSPQDAINLGLTPGQSTIEQAQESLAVPESVPDISQDPVGLGLDDFSFNVDPATITGMTQPFGFSATVNTLISASTTQDLQGYMDQIGVPANPNQAALAEMIQAEIDARQ